METFIRFFFAHLERIIYICVGVICLLSAFVVWWQVFGRKGLKTGDAPEVDMSGIEEMLTKILSQTHAAINTTTAAAAADDASGGVDLSGVVGTDGKPITDAEGVKKELEERAKIIEGLQKEVATFKDSNPSGELLAKIKNLEARLVEYEIIEDDIADLSHYKEENAKLKKELDALKRADPQMVEQFAQAVADQAPPVAATAEPEMQGDSEIDAMAAAMAADAPSDDPLSAAVAAAQTTVDSDTPADAGGAAAEAPTDGGDIFSEFSGTPSDDPMAALGDIDPDRMLDELKDLNADMAVGAEALEEEPDMDKMAAEAVGLSKKKEA